MIIIDKIIAFLKKYYRVDYLAHLLVGIGLSEMTLTITHMFRGNFIHYLITILGVIFVILFKDIVYDKWLKKGTFEWPDLIIAFIGVGLVIVQWLLLLI